MIEAHINSLSNRHLQRVTLSTTNGQSVWFIRHKIVISFFKVALLPTTSTLNRLAWSPRCIAVVPRSSPRQFHVLTWTT